MAKTIAIATGVDAIRNKITSRLGSREATGQANTWRTFTTCHVRDDGSGYVLVERIAIPFREKMLLHRFDFGPEETA